MRAPCRKDARRGRVGVGLLAIGIALGQVSGVTATPGRPELTDAPSGVGPSHLLPPSLDRIDTRPSPKRRSCLGGTCITFA